MEPLYYAIDLLRWQRQPDNTPERPPPYGFNLFSLPPYDLGKGDHRLTDADFCRPSNPKRPRFSWTSQQQSTLDFERSYVSWFGADSISTSVISDLEYMRMHAHKPSLADKFSYCNSLLDMD